MAVTVVVNIRYVAGVLLGCLSIKFPFVFLDVLTPSETLFRFVYFCYIGGNKISPFQKIVTIAFACPLDKDPKSNQESEFEMPHFKLL